MSTGKSLKTAIIADDHQIFRKGTQQILEQIDGVRLVAEASDGIEAIAAVRRHQPDMLILDAAMPHARGIEVYLETRRWSPDTRVVLFTGFNSVGFLSDWVQAKVDGILLKGCDEAEVLHGFKTVLNGGSFIAKKASELLEGAVLETALTARERETLALIVSGNTNLDIAKRLNISIKTVDKHRGSLMKKLGVRSVSELMVYALKEGLIDELKQI